MVVSRRNGAARTREPLSPEPSALPTELHSGGDGENRTLSSTCARRDRYLNCHPQVTTTPGTELSPGVASLSSVVADVHM
jgi:hypothetical protein